MVLHPHFSNNNKLTPGLWVLLKMSCRNRSISSVWKFNSLQSITLWKHGSVRVLKGDICLFQWMFWWLSFILSVVRLEEATGWSVEVEYWSTLSTRGKGERCSERGGGDRGGGGKGLYCSAVSWQMKRAVICRKHLCPRSSSPIMDTKHISFKEKPDTVTLYLSILIQERAMLFLYKLEV